MIKAWLLEQRRQRAAAAANFTIKTATFYEYIQLNIFSDILRNFLTTLKAANLFH